MVKYLIGNLSRRNKNGWIFQRSNNRSVWQCHDRICPYAKDNRGERNYDGISILLGSIWDFDAYRNGQYVQAPPPLTLWKTKIWRSFASSYE